MTRKSLEFHAIARNIQKHYWCHFDLEIRNSTVVCDAYLSGQWRIPQRMGRKSNRGGGYQSFILANFPQKLRENEKHL